MGNTNRCHHESVKEKQATCQYGLVQQRTKKIGFEGVGRQEKSVSLGLEVKKNIKFQSGIFRIA